MALARKLKIVVACGSGIATSTVAGLKIESLCKELGIGAQIDHTNLSQVKVVAGDYDLVCTTANYNEQIPTRLLNIVSFVTGINEKKKLEELKAILKEIVGSVE